MTTRTITIDLKTILDTGWAYGTVSFAMVTDVATSGASIYPQSLQKVKMDVDGVGSVDLAVPDTGAWVYEVRLPSTQESQIVVEAGAAVMLAELLETGLTPVPPSGDSYWVRLDGTNTPMTGELLLSGDPVSDAGAATKQTVDAKQDKDTGATAANVAIFDANGQTVDAGYALGTAAQSDAGDFAPALGVDDNYVTDAEKIVIGNTSGTNTGDSASDPAGSAAAVAGDLTNHEGLTGTAVHGLGSASTSDAADFVAVTGDEVSGALLFDSAGAITGTGATRAIALGNNYFIDGGLSSGSSVIQFITKAGFHYGQLLMSNAYWDDDAETYRQERGNNTAVSSYIAGINALESSGLVPGFTVRNSPGNQGANSAITPELIASINQNGLNLYDNPISTGSPQTQMVIRSILDSEFGGYAFDGWGFVSDTGTNRQVCAFFDGVDDDIIFSVRTSKDSGVTWLKSLEITQNSNIKIYTVKSGATQASAGAAAGELWKTAGHATLPDNVVLHGV